MKCQGLVPGPRPGEYYWCDLDLAPGERCPEAENHIAI